MGLGFQATVNWVGAHGYALIFVLMVIEGPVVTAAAAFAAALHYLNLWAVLALSIVGNVIPDALYYAIGYWGRETLVDRWGHYVGLTKDRVRAMEKMIEEHSGKSLVTIKLVPLLATPGLIAAGIVRLDIRKFAFWSFLITIPSSIFYLVIGYYFGAAYDTIDHYLHIGVYLLALLATIVIIMIIMQRKISERFFKDHIENNHK